MDRLSWPPWVPPPNHNGGPDPPKLRRKLQKVARQRTLAVKPPPEALAPNGPWHDRSAHGRRNIGPRAQVKPASMPRRPDLSDAKWQEYLGRNGYPCAPNSSAQSKGAPNVPRVIIPELSHLAPRDARPRVTWDLPEPNPPPSCQTTAMRRRAKTPVFSIGQLESPRQDPDFHEADKTPGVEVLAEQYRALLESRMSMLTDSHSEPPPSRGGDQARLEARRNSAGELQLEKPVGVLQDGSPASDGTLVAFDEETVYFKPVSYSPEPPSPTQTHEFIPILSPSICQPDNLSLQICLDLLTRELASGMTDRPQRNGNDLVALQIWVMIEAYERVRDQLLDARLRQDELQPLELMFDMWLRALYTIHDTLTGGSTLSDDGYEMLEAEALD